MPSRMPTVSTGPKSIILMLMFVATLAGLLPAQLNAQTAMVAPSKETVTANVPQQSIGNLLNPEGSLDLESGFKGSLDVQGYKMVSAPGEAPRFVLDAAQGDKRWAEGFGPVGVDSAVYALVADGGGNIYVGGSFTKAGEVGANYVAKWNGHEWSALGSGMNGLVYALALDGSGNLYAGGQFTRAGGVTAYFIARWNGSAWSPLGAGIILEDFAYVSALAVDGSGNLYAGGYFTTAGGLRAHNIAKWDGSVWSPLGAGMRAEGIVRTLCIDGNGNLYAGGFFSTAGGLEANNIAKWNGSVWSALGSGMNTGVDALALDRSGNLYAGGLFTTAGGAAANHVAQWNGSSWSALGSGVGSSDQSFVSALACAVNGSLYVGGLFTTAGGVSANHIARWNGSSWSALGSGVSSGDQTAVAALACDGSENLYTGGSFTTAGGVPANGIAEWNGSSWSALGDVSGITADAFHPVYALAGDGSGNLYTGGFFFTADGVAVNSIAKWNGKLWSPLGAGIDGHVHSLALDANGNLYAGGRFSKAGGVAANTIAKWNGTAWAPLGSGISRSAAYLSVALVSSLAVDVSGNLYAGGSFTTAGEVAANNISRWNGRDWSTLGSGIGGHVSALAVDGSGNLYAGGYFSRAGAAAANNIAKWNGTAWSTLGAGVDASVYTLAVDGSGNLYAGGAFTTAGGVAANNLAKWNGTAWSALGAGVDAPVYTLAIDGSGSLYAGGSFTTAGGVAANNIAKWNGTAWSALGAGTDRDVNALTVDVGGNLYAGGEFTTAGGKSSIGVAKWMGRPALAVDFPLEGLQLWDGSRKKISSQHPSVLTAWGDRLVVSFPELGLYLHDGSSWTKLSSLKSTESALGIADSLYVDAGARGVYRYKGGWKKIHTSNPTMMASCGEKLVANFPGIGIWTYDGSEWKRISQWTTAEQMVGIGGRLFVDFGASGIHRYDGRWVKISAYNPGVMHAYGNSLAASFDSASIHGLYLYRSKSWTRISSDPSAESFASTPFTLYVDRGELGTYMYEKKKWTRISAQDPDGISIYAGKLVANLPDKGLYLYSNLGWKQLSADRNASLMQGLLFK